jgi:hypothetical protein
LENQADLSARIERLRKEIWWTKCLAAVSILCFAALSIASWMRHPNSVEAKEFLVKDRAGNLVARLGQDKFGVTCLTLTAKKDVSIASLCVQDDEGSLLDLHNLKSESRAMLTPGFNMIEPAGHFQPALIINAGSNDPFLHINLGRETTLVMGDGSKESVAISSIPENPKITLFGADQKPIWSTH